MIRFSREEYLDGARLTIESRKTAEEAADQIWREGYDNLFLTAVGGSTVPMMAAAAIVKEMTDLPVFVEQAAELAVRGNRNLTAKSWWSLCQRPGIPGRQWKSPESAKERDAG